MKKILIIILCFILIFPNILTLISCSSQKKMEEEWNEMINYTIGLYPSVGAFFTGYKDEKNFKEFIVEKFDEMNDETLFNTLMGFERAAEIEWNDDIKYDLLNPVYKDYIQERFLSSEKTFEDKLELSHSLLENIFDYQFLDYYQLRITATQEEFEKYMVDIEEIVYTEHGSGYYAEKENESSGGKIGLDDSPLYSASSDRYYGDFHINRSSGTRLDHTYHETSYSISRVYFKERELDIPSTASLENFRLASPYLFYKTDSSLRVFLVTSQFNYVPDFTIEITE